MLEHLEGTLTNKKWVYSLKWWRRNIQYWEEGGRWGRADSDGGDGVGQLKYDILTGIIFVYGLLTN